MLVLKPQLALANSYLLDSTNFFNWKYASSGVRGSDSVSLGM